MATTYYAYQTGNWATNASWSTNNPPDATNTGTYPVAGDTAIFNASFTGTITLAASAACLNLTMTGNGGTLAFTSNNMSIGSGGAIVLDGTITATTGGIVVSGNIELTCNTVTFPGFIRFGTSGTYKLNDDLDATNIIISSSTPIFSGEHDILCTNFYGVPTVSANTSLSLVAGQTLTISNSITCSAMGLYTYTIKSATESSATNINYSGTVANCNVSGVTFIDIDASGSAQRIDNWNGGTLTRTTGITNVTSADIGGGGPLIGGRIVC